MFEELGSDFVITEERYKQLKEWLAEYLVPTKRFNNFDTESSIKHAFEFSEDGFYVHDDIVVAAMLDAGFRVKDENIRFTTLTYRGSPRRLRFFVRVVVTNNMV